MDLSGIQAPSKFSDIFKIEEQNWGVKFHIFEYSSKIVRHVHSTRIENSQVTKNIHLLKICYKQNYETLYHWVPIVNLSKFMAKIYMGKKRASFSNTMSCPYCLKNINFDSKNKQSKHMFNESQSQELLSHMEKCKSGQQTILKFPEEKYLKFREVVKKSMEISILLFELSHPPNEWKNRHCIIWHSLTACCVGTCFTWRYLNKL